jgi:hypothetical protein
MNSENEKMKNRMSRWDSIGTVLGPAPAALAHGRFDEFEQLSAQGGVRSRAQIVAQLHCYIMRAELGAAEYFAREPLAPVAVDGSRRRFPARDDAKPRMVCGVRNGSHDKVAARNAAAVAQYVLEFGALAKDSGCAPARGLSERCSRRQTASRARPFARRALMTARPALVFIRTRKP